MLSFSEKSSDQQSYIEGPASSESIQESPQITTPESTIQESPEINTSESTIPESPEINTSESPQITTSESPEITTSESIQESPEITTSESPEITTSESPEITTSESPEITTSESIQESPEITTSESIQESPEITTSESIQESPEITTEEPQYIQPSSNALYDNPDERQYIDLPEDATELNNTSQTEITPEEYQLLDEKEKSIRSKIINQPPPCQKKQTSPTDTYVEKVQLKTPLIENEREISNILKTQIPQAFLYFQPLIETRPLSIGTITECENIDTTNATTAQEDLIEATYKSAGNKTLEEFLQAQIRTPKQANKFIQLLVNSHLQLLDSVQLLQSTNPPIVHFHITPQTILYDETNGTPVITDFRLAFTKTTIESQEESNDLFPIYENNPSWPIEVFLLSHLIETPEKSIEELAPLFNNPTKQITNIETIKYKGLLDLKQSVLSWDTYSINQLIYSFLTTSKIPFNIPFMRTYIELITKELTAEPNERSQIPSLQSKIRDIFKAVPKKEYLDFLQKLIY
jgi:hypothetical protein